MLEKVDILVKLKVTQADGTTSIGNTTNVTTVPHLAAALWRNVDFSIGGVSLTQSFDNAYTMATFWQTILHTPAACEYLKWKTEGLLLDSGDSKSDSESVAFFGEVNVVNSNGKLRANRLTHSSTVELISELNVPLLKQDKLLPPATEYHLELTKNTDEFMLIEADQGTSKVVFEKVFLRCTFKRPAEWVLSELESRLAKENAIYHADKVKLTFISLQDTVDHTIDVFNGRLPYCFIIGVQDRSALARTRSKNPFSLHPMKRVQLYTNGSEHFPKPIEYNITNHETGLIYETFLREVGNLNNCDILLHNHYETYPAMAFDLTTNKNINNSLNLTQQGTCRLSLELYNEANNYVLMVLAFYEQTLEISKDREVTVI